MFQSTQPHNDPELIRASAFARDLESTAAIDTLAGTTRLSALNPSLMQDLQRFGAEPAAGCGLEPLEVMAASLRHCRDLLVHLQIDGAVLPMTILPTTWQLQCPLTLDQLLALRLPELRVLRVQPARRLDPTDEVLPISPLRPLLWDLAMRGAREALLPEIAGIAAYRVPPGSNLRGLTTGVSIDAAVSLLQRQTTPLRGIAAYPGFDAGRATRLLNALYLQAALMVSRTHPAALPTAAA